MTKEEIDVWIRNCKRIAMEKQMSEMHLEIQEVREREEADRRRAIESLPTDEDFLAGREGPDGTLWVFEGSMRVRQQEVRRTRQWAEGGA